MESEVINIVVSAEKDGWYVRHGARIGPFFAKQAATDLAGRLVADLRESGRLVRLSIVSDQRPSGRGPTTWIEGDKLR